MHIKMRIIEVHPEEHSIVVRYYSDKLTEEMLLVRNVDGGISRREDGTPLRCRTDANLSIWQVPAPTGQALLDYIFRNSPPSHAWFELQEKIADPAIDTSLANVKVDTVADAPPAPQQLPAPQFPDPRGAIQLRARRALGRQIGTTLL